MKYLELIKYLTDSSKLPELYKMHGVDPDSEAIIIFFAEKFELNSEIALWEIEETEGELEFVKDGLVYMELFPVNHAVNLIEFDLNLKDKGYSDEQIAQRLLEYRINDA